MVLSVNNQIWDAKSTYITCSTNYHAILHVLIHNHLWNSFDWKSSNIYIGLVVNKWKMFYLTASKKIYIYHVLTFKSMEQSGTIKVRCSSNTVGNAQAPDILFKFQCILPLGTGSGHAKLCILLQNTTVPMLKSIFTTSWPIPRPKTRTQKNIVSRPPRQTCNLFIVP